MVIPGLKGMSLRRFFVELKDEVIDNGLVDVAAQLAFNALLALFPFIIFLVTILGFLPIQGVMDEILRVTRTMMPADASTLLDQTVQGVVRNPNKLLLVLSLVFSMYSASSGVAALTTSLNMAYEAKETRSWVRVRLRSLVITLLATVLVVVATVALMIGPQLVERVSGWFGLGALAARVWGWLRWPSTVLAMSCLLAVLYYACPNVKQKFRFVTPGSIVAVPLWIGVSLLFNVYVTHLGAFNKTYGALGAGVVLLLWIYITGLIVLVGGQMNAVIERHSPDGAPESNQPARARGAARQVVTRRGRGGHQHA